MSYYTIPENIVIVICSKYSETREPFLKKVLTQALKYGKNKRVIILSDNNKYLSFINNLRYNLDVSIFVPDMSTLPHLFFLPWLALKAFYLLLKKDPSITHFLYLEDDLNISPELIHFQTFYLDLFKDTKFFPGAIRVEQITDETSDRRPLGKWYASDQTSPLHLKKSPVLETNDWYFVPLPNPHQGFYYYTRDQIIRLIDLGIKTPFRDSTDFGLPREHAAAGLTWDTPPEGWPHRLVVPVCKNSLQIPSICHVHHMGDSYANGSALWAQLPIEDVIKA